MEYTINTSDISKTLYKINASGKKIQQWRVYIDKKGSKVFIMREYGQIDGKLQTREKEVTETKSKDTLENQAIFQAKREWLDQIIKKQYSINKPDLTSSKKQKLVKGFAPMLAQTYDSKKAFKTPCVVQPKLDGVRAYYIEGVFRSRNHKVYYNMEHLSKVLSKVKENVIFDGELYNHDMTFQTLMKYVKLKLINDDKDKKIPDIQKYVEYHIFDCYFPDNPDMPFNERYSYLVSIQKQFAKSKIKIVNITKMSDISKLNGFHDEFASEGYEGIMLRNSDSKYEFKRSKHLQKYKKFIDEEFEVIGFTKEIENNIPLVVWRCKTDGGLEFNCRPKGTHKERAVFFKNANDYIGKILTVKFQEYTDDGIPRFPVGKGFRDDI
mgnify:FL=1